MAVTLEPPDERLSEESGASGDHDAHDSLYTGARTPNTPASFDTAAPPAVLTN
jgi:hypothetical protein